jgi:uncharacterized surface protein with fasciclin (FAS1) repeats
MKKLSVIYSFIILLLFSTCREDIGDNYVTFQEETITSFLTSQEEYAEFTTLLNAANLLDLLSAYGTYTCFAPTNEAVSKYYEQKGKGLDQMTEKEIREIAYNHLINKGISSLEFPSGVISEPNMDDRFLTISYDKSVDGMPSVFVNDSSRIIIFDQKLHNGIVHTVSKVLEPSKIQLPEVIGANPRFKLFAEALYATGMSDSLRLMKDETYVQKKILSSLYNNYWDTPPFKKYGYTALIESDSLYTLNGIHNLEDLKDYAAKAYAEVYPQDKDVSDITDRRNSLNRFVSYHLLDREQGSNEFITDDMMSYLVPRSVLFDYIETMCPNTLLEVQTGTIFNKRKDGTSIRFLKVNHKAENGIFHEIDRILVYDKGMENDVLNKRIRFEVESMLPELTTNKVRFNYQEIEIPPGYTRNVTYTESTEAIFKLNRSYRNHLGTEILLGGKYDFTYRIPAVPPATYEIHFSFVATPSRGVAQLYFDDEPCGIPLDMRIEGDSPKIGWVNDNQTEDNGLENDKMMRNRGYLKGTDVAYIFNNSNIERFEKTCLRLILTTKTFDTYRPHTLRVKSVEERRDREFKIDYLDFIPTSYLEKEGRD